MNSENDHAYYRMQLVAETQKAYCVHILKTEEQVWVPKSLCEIKGEILEVEEWFSKQENFDG